MKLQGGLPIAAAALAVSLAAGCARVGQPSGGPADSTPPEITVTTPAEGATGVDRDTEIRLEFSEEMARIDVERSFSIEPAVELNNFRWDGSALVAIPKAELPDSTTFTVRVAESAKDYHDVALGTPFVLAFSTGDVLDTGVISGTVSVLGEAVPGATVWACRPPVGAEENVITGCRYAARTGLDGSFRISGVAAAERPYVLLAFVDADEDGTYSVGEETGRISDVAALIDSPGTVAAGIQIGLEAVPDGGPPDNETGGQSVDQDEVPADTGNGDSPGVTAEEE